MSRLMAIDWLAQVKRLKKPRSPQKKMDAFNLSWFMFLAPTVNIGEVGNPMDYQLNFDRVFQYKSKDLIVLPVRLTSYGSMEV